MGKLKLFFAICAVLLGLISFMGCGGGDGGGFGDPPPGDSKVWRYSEVVILAPAFREVATYTYDKYGNMIKRVLKRDNSSNGIIDYLETEVCIYADNNIVNKVYTRDSDNNNVWDYAYSYVYTYDVNNNIIKKVYKRDADKDDDVDYQEIQTYTYDVNNNMTGKVYERDKNSNGTIDYSENQTYTYDVNNNMIGRVYKKDNGNNGTDYEETYTYLNTYSNSGNLIKKISERDINSDGSVDYQETEEYEYDQGGNITKKNTCKGDFYLEITSYIYDVNGNMTSRVCEIDIDNNNSIDYIEKRFYAYTYDDNKNIIKKLSQTDNNNDGIIDFTATEKYIWEEFK